ncbi:MAG: FHA domain-containing protein [Planctomycetes bacterium]|nr:FHA domain-containing protein [Planctomycetota bacterium]
MTRFEFSVRAKGRPRPVEVEGPRVRIGRVQVDNEVVADEETVDAHHAELRSRDGGFVIADRASAVGTLVNGRPVDGEHPLADGDVVHLGAYRMAVRLAPDGVFRAELEPDPPLSLRKLAREQGPRRRTGGRPPLRWILGGAALCAAVLALAAVPLAGWHAAFLPAPISPAHRDGPGAPSGCGACHTPFGGGFAEGCMACHGQVLAGGPHGAAAFPAAGANECSGCHAEHERIEGGLLGAGTLPGTCRGAGCHEEAHPAPRPVATALVPVPGNRPPFSHADHARGPSAPGCAGCHAPGPAAGGDWRDHRPMDYEGCVRCHDSWAVADHGFPRYCGDCHARPAEPELTRVRREVAVPAAFAFGGFRHDLPVGACGGCHLRPDVELESRFRGTPFRHATHLVAGPRGVGAGGTAECASCHGEVARSTELPSRASPGAEAPMTWDPSSCKGCHLESPHITRFDVVARPSVRFGHDGHAGAGLDCAACHAPGEEPDRPTLLAGVADCTACHAGHARTPRLEACARCHAGADLYARGVPVRRLEVPEGFDHATWDHRRSPCEACHPGASAATTIEDVPTARADSEACTGCHEPAHLAGPCLDCHAYHEAATGAGVSAPREPGGH